GDPVYALGAVTLDDDWLAIYPELKNAMQALDLRIGIPDEDATVLVAEGADAASRLTAALLGNEAWAGFLSGNKQSPVSKMFYPMLFAALLLAGWTWLRERSEHALDVKRRASLQRWVQNLIAHGQ